VLATGLGVAASGCSGRSGDRQTVGDQPATTTKGAAATSATPGLGSGRQSSPTSGASQSQPAKPLPFAADTKPDTSTTVEGYPVLVSVTQGEHNGYRRYVFTFRHMDPEGHQPWRVFARPAWDVRYVPASQAVMDASGDPLPNGGAAAHLRIVFHADVHDREGHSTLERSVNDEPPDLAFAGDFENRASWVYGAPIEQPFRVEYVGDGRVAVDIVR
jgi:hypothetical protein